MTSQALELASKIAVFTNCGAVGQSSFASGAYASTAEFRLNGATARNGCLGASFVAKALEGRQSSGRFYGTGRALGRNSLLTVGLGLAACFSVYDANAQCPGVSADLSIPGTGVVETCGANTGAITASDLSSNNQKAIEERRNQIQEEPGSGPPMRFAPDSPNSTFDAAFSALGYANSPMYTKAKPLEPGLETALWGRGSYTYENQTGISNGTNFGALSRTAGGLAGIDWTWALPAERYFTFGAFGGEGTTTHTMPLGDRSTTRAPTAGAYILYFVGKSFSMDLTYAHSWFQNSGPNMAKVSFATGGSLTETAQETATAVDFVEGNLHYRFNPNAQNGSWWWEPTFGVEQAFITQSMGLQNQTITRVKGGVNVGTSFDWGTVKVEPKLTGLAFSDVSVNGVDPGIATDRGQLWGKGIATLNFVWTKNFSTAIEGQVYRTSGTLNIIGYKGLLQVRCNW